jgi:predicted ferric reductase
MNFLRTREWRARAAGHLGVLVLAAIAVGNVILWLVARPRNQPGGSFVGELCGSEAVLLLSSALLLATLIPVIEKAFGGLDRVALWHRRVAVAAVVLLVPHLVLVTSAADQYATPLGSGLGDIGLAGLALLSLWALAPGLRAARWPGPIRRLARASYEHWLSGHRLTGLFVAAAVAHGAIVDPVLHRSLLLRTVFLVVGGTGLVAYVYRELFARYILPIHEYSVARVYRLTSNTLEVALDPSREPLRFAPGQFVFLAFGGFGAWQRHPFSVSSAPSDRTLNVTIKAAGDFTEDLFERLRPGIPAKLTGPFGGFDYRQGGRSQIWIAAGIGITPFISWIRALDDSFDRDVDIYYAVPNAGAAIYLDEIEAAARRHPSLRPHLVFSDDGFKLTADEVMEVVPIGVAPWVYMCGPPRMMKTLAKGLRRQGVAGSHVRWEQFGAR